MYCGCKMQWATVVYTQLHFWLPSAISTSKNSHTHSLTVTRVTTLWLKQQFLQGLVCFPDLNVCEFAITAMVEVILVHDDGIVYPNQPGKL